MQSCPSVIVALNVPGNILTYMQGLFGGGACHSIVSKQSIVVDTFPLANDYPIPPLSCHV